jgi:ornithine cyclodeaminase/alanine dehydrogenase-like protein (mu-crystallin family)
MRIVSADEIDAALNFPDLIAALDQAFCGDIIAPKRHHHVVQRSGGDATLLLMPAWSGASGAQTGTFLGVKIVSVYPDNASRGLPSIMGTYLLMDGASGQPFAAMDGARLTLWRTAAASALAASHLARADAETLLICGAGALAPFLIRAHMSVRAFKRVSLWNHRPEKARALASDMQEQGVAVTAVSDLESAVRGADVISCATLAKAPFIQGQWLKPGTHLDLVGAFNLTMREVDDAALIRASLFIDTAAALSEGGDIAIAIAAGRIQAGDIKADLAALCAGRHIGRAGPDEITLFKSVGAALEDLAAAQLVWSRRAIAAS